MCNVGSQVQITNCTQALSKFLLSWLPVMLFSRKLLTSNNMISSVIWCKYAPKTTNCTHLISSCDFFLYLKNLLVLTNILRPIAFEIISLLMLIGREDYENKNTDKWTFREDNDGDQLQTRLFLLNFYTLTSVCIFSRLLYTIPKVLTRRISL